MSIADRLEESSIKLKRKLFDQKIKLLGKSTKVIRLKIDKNKYGDGELKIISKDTIDCIIDYPGDIPLNRTRPDSTTNEAGQGNLFLFDIIPIDIYTQWTDNVEKFDFIIDRIKDENGNYITFILQLSDMVGTFRTSLQWRKGLCAPYNGPLTQDIQTIIDTLL